MRCLESRVLKSATQVLDKPDGQNLVEQSDLLAFCVRGYFRVPDPIS